MARGDGPIALVSADSKLIALEAVQGRLNRVVRESPADETAITWLESRSRRTGVGAKDRKQPPVIQRNVLVRVMEAGRLGIFRTAAESLAEIHSAVRSAMAHARASPPVPGFPHLAHEDHPLPRVENLWDEAILQADPTDLRTRLEDSAREGDIARIEWSEIRLVVSTSRNLRRAVRATAANLEVRSGRSVGSGFSAGVRRNLRDLPIRKIFDRAHSRRGDGSLAELPVGPTTVLLSPESVATLLDLLNRIAFTAQSYQMGDSFLREYLGQQVFDRSFDLIDDGLHPNGLPFPCDLEGSIKRAVPLVEAGVPRTPALDQLHAAVLGLPPTPHAFAGDDARAEHLFLRPGDSSWDELQRLGDGGVWVTSIEHVECFDRRRLLIRARAKGVRRIENGRLGRPLPDLTWEGGLLSALGQVAAIGKDPQTLADPSGELGAICTPALLLRKGSQLSF